MLFVEMRGGYTVQPPHRYRFMQMTYRFSLRQSFHTFHFTASYLIECYPVFGGIFIVWLCLLDQGGEYYIDERI